MVKQNTHSLLEFGIHGVISVSELFPKFDNSHITNVFTYLYLNYVDYSTMLLYLVYCIL